jgi:anthranilate phosphoribosyltransferase
VIGKALERVRRGETLASDEMREVFRAIVKGEEAPEEVAALLTALHERGETVEEVVGAAEALRELAVPLPEAPPEAIDTCGTGGDRSGSFNISTVSALVVAGAGVPVAKHGNRSATSRCGSADLLEALGVRIDLPPERAAAAVTEVGIGFLFARACHPAMARVAPIRAKLAHPTIFNRLGPLTNPMRVRRQLVGVANAAHVEATRDALVRLGSERVWVVHGGDGLDEISLAAPTRVLVWENGRTDEFEIVPEQFTERGAGDLSGGDAAHNARLARQVLSGKPGVRRDVVLLNAGAALVVAGRVRDLAMGLQRAAEVIDAGRAHDVLERWIGFTRAAGQGV